MLQIKNPLLPLQIRLQRILKSKLVKYFVLTFIILSITAIVASSFEEMQSYAVHLFKMTYISSIVFLAEFAIRIFAAPALYPQKGVIRARLKYIFSFYGFVDFIAILPCILTYFYWNSEIVHIIILPYIFIIFKLLRHSKSFQLIGEALYAVRDELITAYTACFIMISFSAILMYYIEHNAQPEVFNNIGSGFWWCIVAFTTTGYGDIYPITMLGKFLGSFISLIGIAMITIPSGIISSSFIHNMQKNEKRKHNADNRHNNEA